MSAEIFAAQLDAGAWGMTVATGNQLLAAYSFGVRRILVANEIVDPTVLRWIAACEDAEILFYVDSVEGVARAAAAGGRCTVLLEVGLRPDRRAVARAGDGRRAARSRPRETVSPAGASAPTRAAARPSTRRARSSPRCG